MNIMKHGIVLKNITDLLAEPNFLAERKSQLLFNEPVRIDREKDNYYHVVQPDGYTGWIYRKAVSVKSNQAIKNLVGKPNYIVSSKTAKVNLSLDNAGAPKLIFYGTKLHGTKGTDGRIRSKDINGTVFSVSLSNLKPYPCKNKPDRAGIISEAKKFLGVPYLWGGISPYGFDCSGFVRTIFRQFGIDLPRDSSQQARVGELIAIDDFKPADLIFFKGHVAICLTGKKIIHASLGEGGVAINSLEPGADGFRGDLYETFISARRIVR